MNKIPRTSNTQKVNKRIWRKYISKAHDGLTLCSMN